MKKSLLISAVVAAFLIGCGGSSTGSCCGFKPDGKGEGVIVATKGGLVEKTSNTITARDSSGTVTSSCECISVKKDDKPACQPTNVEADKCKLSLIQKPSCDKNNGGALALAQLTSDDIFKAKEHIAIDSSTESISYGGSTTLKSLNGNVDEIQGNFTFALPDDMCGKNVDNPDKPLGFGGYHKESVSGVENRVYALIADANGSNWYEGTIVGGQVVFPNVHIKLDPDFGVKVKVFRVTDIQGTGMTGSTGAGSY